MNESNIVNIDNAFITQCVFERVALDKHALEEEIRQAAIKFLNKYPGFKIESASIFDVYCSIKCVVNLQLK